MPPHICWATAHVGNGGQRNVIRKRLGQTTQRASNHVGGKYHHSRSDSAPTRSLASFAQDYRKLAIDCLKVLRIEMQLETVFHMQEMANTEYLDDQDAEEPDDFIISLTAQITRRDEEMAPFISNAKRNYIFGGICGVAANASVKALADMKSINLFGVQQICRNAIALEQETNCGTSFYLSNHLCLFLQHSEGVFFSHAAANLWIIPSIELSFNSTASRFSSIAFSIASMHVSILAFALVTINDSTLQDQISYPSCPTTDSSLTLPRALAAIPSINSEAVQQRLDRALVAFITEHIHLFTPAEYAKLLNVQVPGREVPPDAQDRLSEILSM
ncbi:Putative exocyst complex component 4 [Glycine soja]|nr:Putative exocyst complex component 4 [Glycine soja]